MRYAVIMAGGAGTRLWPMSRTGRPKQLLRFIGGQSLLGIAAARMRGLIEPQRLYICTGASYRDAVLADLPMLPASQLLGEPMGRDTANAVAFSAAVLAKRDPESSFCVLTADHIIEPLDVFQRALSTAFDFVEAKPEYLVTFGITPSHPATGFGYLQRGNEISPGVFKVDAFCEKPKEDKAREYLKAGNFAWNSGMFVWKSRTILEQLKEHLPASYEGVQKIAAAWDTPRQDAVLNEIYPTLPKISIDFAVMEKAPHVATVAMPVKWLDVGSWPAFGETLTPDAAGNRTGGGQAVHIDSKNVLVASDDPGHVVATINCEDLIIIHTAKATLVCPAKDAERIKAMVAEVAMNIGKDYV